MSYSWLLSRVLAWAYCKPAACQSVLNRRAHLLLFIREILRARRAVMRFCWQAMRVSVLVGMGLSVSGCLKAVGRGNSLLVWD